MSRSGKPARSDSSAKRKQVKFPVTGTLLRAWNVFKREWWKLVLLAASLHILQRVIAILPIPPYPEIPDLVMLFRNPGDFLRQLLQALPFDLLWVFLYSWLDGAKTRIVANSALRTRQPRFANLFKFNWKVLGRIMLIRVCVGLFRLLVDPLIFLSSFKLPEYVAWLLPWVFNLAALCLAVLVVLMPFKIVMQRKGFFEGIRESFISARPHFWRILAVVVLAGVPYLSLKELHRLITTKAFLQALSSSDLASYLWFLLPSLIEIFGYAFGWSALGVIYARLKDDRPKPDH